MIEQFGKNSERPKRSINSKSDSLAALRRWLNTQRAYIVDDLVAMGLHGRWVTFEGKLVFAEVRQSTAPEPSRAKSIEPEPIAYFHI